MKTIYRADDGKEFDTALDCHRYERSMSIGSDARFVDKLAVILQPVIASDDRGNDVIHASTDDTDEYSLTEMAIYLADHLDELVELRDQIAHERMKPKNPGYKVKPKSNRSK
jgi:hypothetical protein